MKILLAAGGTAGHVFPAVALGRALIAAGHQVSAFSDARGQRYFPDGEWTVTVIPSGGLVSGSPVARAKGLLRLGQGLLSARTRIKALAPDVVVGFGGYPSAPPLLAAQLLGIPTVLHEQNSVFGKANQLTGRKAKAIALSFAGTQGAPDGAQMTGNPVRSEFETIAEYAAPTNAPTNNVRLLVTGGSLGGAPVAKAVPAALKLLDPSVRDRLDVLAQMPADLVDELAQQYQAIDMDVQCLSFIDDMPSEIAQAHLVIARSGATTVTELIAAARPALFVPLDVHADQHQIRNAQAMVDAGGAAMLPNSELSPESLAQILANLLDAPDTLTQMGQAAKALANEQRAARGGRSATEALMALVLSQAA